MPRPIKEGLDYFELDCHMDEKIRLIQAEYGLKGFAVVVLLLQEIYGEKGYYMTWDEDRSLLFMSENGATGGDKNLINEIVQACIRRDFFSEKLYQKYHILTSSGIQKRYFNAVARRGKVEVKKEYLLISVDKNRVNVCNNSINVDNNSINVDKNSQSREEKKREEKSIKENTTYSLLPDGSTQPENPPDETPYQEVVNLFHDICRSYPRVRALSENRKKAIKARLKKWSLSDIREAFTKAEQSDFMKGANNRNWSADFDWMMNDANLTKILEGKYDNSHSQFPPKQQEQTKSGYSQETLDRLVNERREDFG